jgi:hypothetical protein
LGLTETEPKRDSVGSAGSSLARGGSCLLCQSLEEYSFTDVGVALTDFFSAFPLAWYIYQIISLALHERLNGHTFVDSSSNVSQ